MCFLALPLEVPACPSAYKCIDIHVIKPNITFDYLVTPTRERRYHSAVGCHFEACLQAQDTQGLYHTDIHPVEGSMPEGATFDEECGMNHITTVAYDVKDGGGAAGAAEAEAEAVLPLYSSSSAAMFPPMPRRRGACKKCFRWEAKRGSETSTHRPCFRASDTALLTHIDSCFLLEVPKCKYCVHQGDTLQYLNKRYQLNTNWLQLWNSNGIEEIMPHPLSPTTVYTDPDFISNGFSIVNAGPTYTVQKGEDIVSLATLFRTSVKKILDVNPDVLSTSHVTPGLNLCVMPCTDTPFIYNDNPNAV